jgi:competence protein ComEC
MNETAYVVILAGGEGTRLWPLSRSHRPKQLLRLTGERSLIRLTVDRVLPLVPPERILVVTERTHADLVREELPDLPAANILVEAARRNTAPAMLLAALHIQQRAPNATWASLHSDAYIADDDEFRRTLAAALGAAARPVLAYLDLLAERFAALRGSSLGLRAGSPLVVIAAYAVLAAVALGAALAARRIGPGTIELTARWRRLGTSGRRLALTASVVLLALALVLLLGPHGPPRALTVRFLDVGQGDATLIQHPDGTAVLFDGGPPEAGVARLLARAGVRRLAVVVATHQSRDHQGGLPEVLERFPVGLLLDGGDGTRNPSFRALEAEADRRGVRRVAAVAPMELRAGGLRIRVLSPPPRPQGPLPDDPNGRAVVAIVSSGAFHLFLSADAESEALETLRLSHVEAMKVPHHGSADPGLALLLRRLRPELAGIEVGRHNPYGHPAPSTLATLRRAHVPTYRTDRDGTVTLTVDRGLRVATER